MLKALENNEQTHASLINVKHFFPANISLVGEIDYVDVGSHDNLVIARRAWI